MDEPLRKISRLRWNWGQLARSNNFMHVPSHLLATIKDQIVDLTGQPLHGIRVSGLRVKRITKRSSEAYEDPTRLLICTLI